MLKTNLEMMEKDEEDFFCQSAGKSYNTNTMVEIFSGRSETVSTNLEQSGQQIYSRDAGGHDQGHHQGDGQDVKYQEYNKPRL